MLTVGSRGSYEWLVTNEDFNLLQLCPEVVLGKYVAVTSIDSSEFVPTARETATGWQSHGKIAYSPKFSVRLICRAKVGMNGTSLTPPQTSAKVTFVRMSLTCHEDRDTSACS